ncbi:MAG: hypothetical protein WC521_01075 [Bdellovibrionales bacterium]|jgi:hypothetical protein
MSKEKTEKMQACRRAILFKLLDACGRLSEPLVRGDELNAKVKDALEWAGYHEETPEWKDIEKRILNPEKLRKEARKS